MDETRFIKVAFLLQSGPVAQLGARFHGMEEVVGSIPTRSTNPAGAPVKNRVKPGSIPRKLI